MSTFGPALRQYRQRAELSLRDVAAATGLTYTYLSKLETGAMPAPSDDALRKIAAALGIADDLLFCAAERLPPDLYAWAVENYWELLKRMRHDAGRQRDAPAWLSAPDT